MKFHILVFLAIIILFASPASAQVDSILGQLSSSVSDSYGGGMTGDGRLVVFESAGNIATENPRNTDGNREIFIFDYAQRRIFQITDTKSLLIDTTLISTFDNIKVDIVNARPVISNAPNGGNYYIAFGSNATYAYPGNGTIPPIVSASNPGLFDANSFTVMGANNLVNDGNLEMWVYTFAAPPAADLTSGAEIPVTNLSAGTFTRATNTLPSRLPQPGDADPQTFPVVADDNADASITENGSHVAFVSTRDLEPGVGNSFPLNEDNEEIFVYNRVTPAVEQITKTPRTPPSSPTKNLNPTISTIAGGANLRVVFYSNANNPIDGMTGGTNSDRNNEIYHADLDPTGNPTLTKKQITSTTGTAGQTINILNYGRRMSRDAKLIAFDSYADLAGEHSGANQTGFALFLYDVTANSFRRIGPRSTADSTATGGDIARYPGFTDNVAGAPNTLVLETRMNIKADGTIPTVNDDGLNPNSTRPAQVYSYPLNVPAASATFTRLTKLPTPFFTLASAQPHPSDSLKRMAFTLGLTEPGTGNFDFSNEVYYLLQKDTIQTTPAQMSYATGASRIPVSNDPVPTPTITPTPTATPTPTPQTPPAVQGISPGMLAILDYQAGVNTPVVAAEAVGSLERSFTLPMELAGVTMTINGVTCGLKRVGQRQIVFTVPLGLSVSAQTNTASYPVVINNNGTVIKGNITIVPGRPDIFTDLPTPGPGGRAKIFNVTNAPFQNGEPFAVTTIKRHGAINDKRRVPTVLRVYLTGVNLFFDDAFAIKINGVPVPTANVRTDAVLREPGVYTVDFVLPAELNGAGDVPIVISVTTNGVTYTSRAEDTAPRFRIL